jgi:hypothetical protein
MRVIPPEFDEPELLAWWNPLLVLARRARLAEPPWALYIDEFRFRGRVKRSGNRVLWVYEFAATLRDVMCDDDGDTYRFVPFADSPWKGRIKACDLDRAMYDAGIPFVPLEPCGHLGDDDHDYFERGGSDRDRDAARWLEDEPEPQPSRRRRGAYRSGSHAHLRLLSD